MNAIPLNHSRYHASFSSLSFGIPGIMLGISVIYQYYACTNIATSLVSGLERIYLMLFCPAPRICYSTPILCPHSPTPPLPSRALSVDDSCRQSDRDDLPSTGDPCFERSEPLVRCRYSGLLLHVRISSNESSRGESNGGGGGG